MLTSLCGSLATVLECGGVTHSAPAATPLTIDGDQFEGGTPVQAGQRPRHLQNPGRAGDRLHAERGGPRRGRVVGTSSTGRHELVLDDRSERGSVLCFEPAVVTVEGGGGFVLHRSSSRRSRWARKSFLLSWTDPPILREPLGAGALEFGRQLNWLSFPAIGSGDHRDGVRYGRSPRPLLPTLQALKSPWLSLMHSLGVLGAVVVDL